MMVHHHHQAADGSGRPISMPSLYTQARVHIFQNRATCCPGRSHLQNYKYFDLYILSFLYLLLKNVTLTSTLLTFLSLSFHLSLFYFSVILLILYVLFMKQIEL